MIKAADLITKFQYALDDKWGYIYGKTHEMWSTEKQSAYAREYAGDPDRENSVKYGGKWIGHWVTDCSGLFSWAFSQLGGTIAHGSNSIWDKYCTVKGSLRNGLRTDGEELKPGSAVFTTADDGKHNHIGLYIGKGLVIEAQGCQAGVCGSYIARNKWTAWGELRGVEYKEGGKTMTAKVVLPSGAKGNTVNMRSRPQSDAEILKRVPVGSTVDVLNDYGTWVNIRYSGTEGFMMSNYIEYDGQGGESESDYELIRKYLDEIARLVDEVQTLLGRG